MRLPRIMVAPNGARKMKRDHAGLPISIGEIVATAASCQEAGADGLHAHVRAGNGAIEEAVHVLDVGLYKELLRECAIQLPGFYVQITSEAVGKYTPQEMDKVIREVKPAAVSVGLVEMGAGEIAREFYHWAVTNEIEVQHILYSAEDVIKLARLVRDEEKLAGQLNCLFVLGRYTSGQQSSPEDLLPFLAALDESFSDESARIEWAVCAFGRTETDCLVAAAKRGGKLRVGFENNWFNRDGSVAKNNHERVREIVAAIA